MCINLSLLFKIRYSSLKLYNQAYLCWLNKGLPEERGVGPYPPFNIFCAFLHYSHLILGSGIMVSFCRLFKSNLVQVHSSLTECYQIIKGKDDESKVLCSCMLQNLSPWRGEAAGLDMREGGGVLYPEAKSPLILASLLIVNIFPKTHLNPGPCTQNTRFACSPFKLVLKLNWINLLNWPGSFQQFLCCSMISPI